MGGGRCFCRLYNVYEKEDATKKTLRNIGVFILFGLVFGLLIYAVFTKTGLYIQCIIGYLIIMFLIRISLFIVRNYYHNKFFHIIRVVNSFAHYCFAASIICIACLGGITKGEVFIIILSCLGIIAFITIDIFRLIKYRRYRRGPDA